VGAGRWDDDGAGPGARSVSVTLLEAEDDNCLLAARYFLCLGRYWPALAAVRRADDMIAAVTRR